MNPQVRDIRYFFFSQHLADGVRISLSILLPVLILGSFGHFDIGMAISLSALCLSITDLPGPQVHRQNGMLVCAGLMVVIAIITGFARMNDVVLGLEIVLVCFFFSMLAVYGVRAGAVGASVVLIMILMMEKPLEPLQIFLRSGLLLAGALWYFLLSVLFYRLRPYRPAQRALGECIRETARFVDLKANFYTSDTNLEEDYRQLIAQQAILSEKQDAVREMLFKTRQIVRDSSGTGRTLMLLFVDLVDLYEQITIMYYDYTSIREKYAKTGLLDKIAALIREMATEMDDIGFAIQSNIYHTSRNDLDANFYQLRKEITDFVEKDQESNIVLAKILVNLRNLHQRVRELSRYTQEDNSPEPSRKVSDIEHSRFVSHQEYSFDLLRDNLTLRSSAFKHALRVAIAALIGFLISEFFPYGQHGYWILLTVAFILKPAYSLTKERNKHRLIGTLIGGIIGVGLLTFIPDKHVLFGFLVLFMIGTYSFLRLNYIWMVICVTPYVLIAFKLLGIGQMEIVWERVLDTSIGCTIAFLVSNLVFPDWESGKLESQMASLLRANLNYLSKFFESFSGFPVRVMDYKVARKEVYVASANMSVVFQRMLSEPKNRQREGNKVYEFVILNHILASNLATFYTMIQAGHVARHSAEELRLLRRSLALLQQSLKQLDPNYQPALAPDPLQERAKPSLVEKESPFVKEQLDFILKVSGDIAKITDGIVKAA